MQVAIVYDRANKWGGAERVLLELREIFPYAQLFTSVHSPKNANWTKKFVRVNSSLISRVPYIRDKHEYLGTLMPIIFECFDLSNFDLVISVTSEAAKGVLTDASTKHICYCLTPTRYLWSHYDEYFKGRPLKGVSKPFVSYLRKWDKAAAQRPDVFVAISTAVQDRIKKYYGRDSVVIHPPLMLNAKSLGLRAKDAKRSDFFLLVSRLVPYKRVDLAIEAFNLLGLSLVIVGTGNCERKLKSLANSNIRFVGRLTDKELVQYYRKAKALIFPQEEDFGLVAVEALAFGTPVIAYKKGGILDIVEDRQNGILYDSDSVRGLTDAIKKFEAQKFSDRIIKRSVEKFSKKRFKKEFLGVI